MPTELMFIIMCRLAPKLLRKKTYPGWGLVRVAGKRETKANSVEIEFRLSWVIIKFFSKLIFCITVRVLLIMCNYNAKILAMYL